MSEYELSFPGQLALIQQCLVAQKDNLVSVAKLFADAIGAGGLVHVYANGHSRLAVEELCVRMGALTGFHPILPAVLSTFTDVIGASGLRLAQAVEQVEGLGPKLLDEVYIAPNEPLIVVSATGQTAAAVDIALEFTRRMPDNPLIVIASHRQASTAPPKHSSGMTLFHVVNQSRRGIFLDNGMPMGDVSTTIEGKTGVYRIAPLSSIGALSIVQCLNELTLRILDSRGIRHCVLENMHLSQARENYDLWLNDQHRRYARAMHNPNISESAG